MSSALRREWNSRPKDVVTLHMFARSTTSPNPSPFPIKVETYMRMVDIKYEPDFKKPFSSKNKSPWITVNGKDVEDSQIVIEYFGKKMGKDLDDHLSEDQRATSRSMRIMVEEHFYWCMVLERWIYDDAKDAARIFPPSLFPGILPKSKYRFFLKKFLKPNLKKQTHGQGLGRHDKETVLKFGRQDLKALSIQLGSKDYMFGEKPSLLDASMFGFATCLMTLPEDSASELKRYFQTELPNLVQHYERIKEKYWPDWEQMKHD